MVITLKTWENLSGKDRNTLRQLGIRPRFKRRGSKPLSKEEPMEGYYLKIITHCNLCQSNTSKYFEMKPSEDGTYLSAQGATEEEAFRHKFKVRHTSQGSCPECFKILMEKWTKEELAKALIRTHPLAYMSKIWQK